MTQNTMGRSEKTDLFLLQEYKTQNKLRSTDLDLMYIAQHNTDTLA